MELRQLEYFVAVVEEASFTRAAERVLVAQSGVSAQVRRLERELGVTLLDRGGRTVTLTEAGAAVLPFARAALAAVGGVREAVDAAARPHPRPRARRHGHGGPVGDRSPTCSATFHALHPEVEITLTEDASDALLAAVRAGELDLACASLGPGRRTGVETQVIIDAPIVAAVAAGHPLATRRRSALDELAAVPAHLPAARDRACGRSDAAGVRARVAFEASDPGVLAQLAARGLGVAILPEPAAGGLHTLASGCAARSRWPGAPAGPPPPRRARSSQHARSSV